MGAKRWATKVEAHWVTWRGFDGTLEGGKRFTVPELSGIYAGDDKNAARKRAIEQAHRVANVPPYRSLLRQSVPYATAVRHMDDDDRTQRR